MSEPARARRSVAVAAGLLLLTMAAVLVVSTRHEHASVGRASPAPAEPTSALRALVPFKVFYRDLLRTHPELVRTLRFTYVANGGRHRAAFLVLPRWYDRHRHLPIPLVIAPHGRGISARDNLRFWGALPAFGPFALVDPVGQGRRLTRYSWGWRGQIDDLARMPRLVEQAVPGLRIDPSRIYAIGSSMGGQVPRAYAERSPITFAREIARSGVPLHLWWSLRDRIVRSQNAESGALYRAVKRFDRDAPVTRYVGDWAHSREMHPLTRLPLVLVRFGLIQLDEPLSEIRGAKPAHGSLRAVQAAFRGSRAG